MKNITVFCDLGKWRLVKCVGNHKDGFRPVERVTKTIPLACKVEKNDKRWESFQKYGYSDRNNLDIRNFPYPDVEKKQRAARQSKSKQVV